MVKLITLLLLIRLLARGDTPLIRQNIDLIIECKAMRERVAELEDRHQRILTWIDAYPLDEVEPDILEESER